AKTAPSAVEPAIPPAAQRQASVVAATWKCPTPSAGASARTERLAPRCAALPRGTHASPGFSAGSTTMPPPTSRTTGWHCPGGIAEAIGFRAKVRSRTRENIMERFAVIRLAALCGLALAITACGPSADEAAAAAATATAASASPDASGATDTAVRPAGLTDANLEAYGRALAKQAEIIRRAGRGTHY